MNSSEYQQEAARTEAPWNSATLRYTGPEVARLDHAAKGLCTEAGEFTDVLKRHLFYGTPLDREHLAEELGDVLWYVALACNALNLDLGEVMAANVRKLKARFPDRFQDQRAVVRDLPAEEAAMRASMPVGEE